MCYFLRKQLPPKKTDFQSLDFFFHFPPKTFPKPVPWWTCSDNSFLWLALVFFWVARLLVSYGFVFFPHPKKHTSLQQKSGGDFVCFVSFVCFFFGSWFWIGIFGDWICNKWIYNQHGLQGRKKVGLVLMMNFQAFARNVHVPTLLKGVTAPTVNCLGKYFQS